MLVMRAGSGSARCPARTYCACRPTAQPGHAGRVPSCAHRVSSASRPSGRVRLLVAARASKLALGAPAEGAMHTGSASEPRHAKPRHEVRSCTILSDACACSSWLCRVLFVQGREGKALAASAHATCRAPQVHLSCKVQWRRRATQTAAELNSAWARRRPEQLAVRVVTLYT